MQEKNLRKAFIFTPDSHFVANSNFLKLSLLKAVLKLHSLPITIYYHNLFLVTLKGEQK